jgi:hypothetical protein
MAYPKKLRDLCPPAAFYFILSMVSLFVMALQNMGNKNKYCLGSFSCRVSSVILIFSMKIVYILFWTWVLNLICKDGHKEISWLLVLFPFILMFVLLGLVLLQG